MLFIYMILKECIENLLNEGPLKDPNKIRKVAIFLIGAGGSGKSTVAKDWLKYAPGYSEGASDEELKNLNVNEKERNLKALNFRNAVNYLNATENYQLKFVEDNVAGLPFRLVNKSGIAIDEKELPDDVLKKLKTLKDIYFSIPKNELPSYFRQINPDLYKEEIPGYQEKNPMSVHIMSYKMSETYFVAAMEKGDPIVVDQTGNNKWVIYDKMRLASEYDYKISLVFVYAPLIICQIRNALRERSVPVELITEQYFNIYKNYFELEKEDIVSKSKVVYNVENEDEEIKKYLDSKDKVDHWVNKSSNGRYETLIELIKQNKPEEYQKYDLKSYE